MKYVYISLSIGILIISGSVAYYFLYFLPNQNSSNTQSEIIDKIAQQQAVQTQQTPQKPQNTPQTITLSPKNMGTPFVINSMEYTIESAQNLGTQFSSFSQPTTGKYIQVKFGGKNIGTGSTHPDAIVYIQDSLKRHYDTASVFFYTPPDGYEEYDSSFGGGMFGFSTSPEMKPGFSKEFVSLFEVASDSTNLILVMANGTNQNYYVPLGL